MAALDMTPATMVVGMLVVILALGAIRRLRRNGTCDYHKNNPHDSGCTGGCAGCSGCAASSGCPAHAARTSATGCLAHVAPCMEEL